MIFIFNSTRNAILAESKCREKNLEFRIVPVPRDVSSECGMCIKTEMPDKVANELTILNIRFRKYDKGVLIDD